MANPPRMEAAKRPRTLPETPKGPEAPSTARLNRDVRLAAERLSDPGVDSDEWLPPFDRVRHLADHPEVSYSAAELVAFFRALNAGSHRDAVELLDALSYRLPRPVLDELNTLAHVAVDPRQAPQ